MIQAWKDADWGERTGAILLALVSVLLAMVVVWAGGIVRQPRAYTDPNAISDTISHSPIAITHIASCADRHVQVSTSGGYSFGGGVTAPASSSKYVHANAMVECLYAAGLTLEYNGEPVRREVTPNE